MLKKALMLLIALALFAMPASAGVFDVNARWWGTTSKTLTVYPNLYGENQCIDFNITVDDSNAAAAIHRLTLDFNVGIDKNRTFVRDFNLSSINCDFTTAANNWANPGAECKINYCFASGEKIANGTYAIDVNAWNIMRPGNRDYNARDVLTLTIDNRYIDSATQSMVNIIPIVLAAMIVIVALLGAFNYIPGKAVMVIIPALVATLIAIIVLTQLLVVMLG